MRDLRGLGVLLISVGLLQAVAAVPATLAKSRSAQQHKRKKPATRRSRSRVARAKGGIGHAARKATSVRHYLVPVSPQVRKVAVAQVTETFNGPHQGVENAGALVPFFERVFSRKDDEPVHILQFGDSHTASDDWANAMREQFQAKFGVGGPGFAVAGHPYRGYRRFDAPASQSSGWTTEGTINHEGDGINGLAGVSITAQRPGETVTLTAQCDHLELYYLQQPGGGSFEFLSDDQAVETIHTDGLAGPGYYDYAPAAGEHKFTIRTLDGAPVRLFGWAADNRSGVTYETLGINGAQAPIVLQWNEAVLTDEIARRNPALIVVAYGTNEALNPRWTSDTYRTEFEQVIGRLRNAAPQASILIVGPPDAMYRVRGGKRMPLPHLDEVITIQRSVARETGCAFWNWRDRMGGPGSVTHWVQAGLSQGDYVHLTTAGYRLLGNRLYEEIMQEYDRFIAVRAEL